MLAARAGRQVLLLERAHFPRDTVSTHLIHQPGVALLARWGLLDAVVATGCPPVEQSSYHIAGLCLVGSSDAADGQRAAYAPRRYLLDQILTDGAVAAGVDFRDQTTVVGLLADDAGRVTGVRYRTPDGAMHQENCRLVVGADGMRSAVARCAGAPLVVEDPTLTCVYYAYWPDLPVRFELHEAPGRFAGLIPTNDGLSVVAAYFPQSEFESVRHEARKAYLDNVRHTVSTLAGEQLSDSRFGKLYGIGDQRNFFRKAYGPGWALVGDAAHHKDSITARGISDGFLQAQLLADCVTPCLDDQAQLDKALAGYELARDDRLSESYYNTLSVAKLEVLDERIRLLRLIQRDPQLMHQYFSIVSGVLSVEEVYSPELLSQAQQGG
jgi:2-polyprenyl-6-methoxyphenol hydroxylase-like FAD-dependent oxidoreductase